MRLLDNALTSTLNGDLSYGPLTGLDQPGGGGISGGPGVEVGYAQSADNGYAEKRQLQYAFILTRAGLPGIYTDGNHRRARLARSASPSRRTHSAITWASTATVGFLTCSTSITSFRAATRFPSGATHPWSPSSVRTSGRTPA